MLYGTAGFFVTYREDGIITYHFEDVSRPTIDSWVEVSHKHDLEYAAKGKHLRRMITANPGLIPSPYALSRAGYLESISPSFSESLVFVIPNAIAQGLIASFVKHLRYEEKYAVRIFRTEDEGISWLNARLKELGK
jgi:hypothetical protein